MTHNRDAFSQHENYQISEQLLNTDDFASEETTNDAVILCDNYTAPSTVPTMISDTYLEHIYWQPKVTVMP